MINHQFFELFRQNLNSPKKKTAAFFFIAISYYASARLGLYFSTETQVSIIWPASGVGIAAMLIFGISYWPAMAVGTLCSQLQTGGPPLVMAGIGMANVIEALVACIVINRLTDAGKRNKVSEYNSTLALIGGNLAGAGLSATLGVFTLYLGNIIELQVFQQNWLTWFAGNYLGGIIIAPFLLLAFFNKTEFRFRDHFKFLITLISGAGICGFLFFSSGGAVFLFLLFPFLLLSIAMLNDLSSKFIVVLVSVMALVSTRSGFGSFHIEITMPFLVHVQLLLIGVSTCSLFVSDFKTAGTLRNPAIALMAGWLISSLIFYTFYTSETKKKADSFAELVNDAAKEIQSQMNSNAVALRSGVGLFAASKTVEQGEWKEFVLQLNLKENGSGLLGMGVVFRVAKNNAAEFLQRIRKPKGKQFKAYDFPDQKIQADEAYIITYLEPEGPNLPAIGLNLASEPDRKAAVDQATDSGTLAVSKGITLVQDSKHAVGLLLFYPVYTHGPVPKDPSERRARSFAWVSAPIRAQDFFEISLNRENFRSISYSIIEVETGRALASSSGFAKLPDTNEVFREFTLANGRYVLRAKPIPDKLIVASSNSYWAGTIAVLLTLLLGAFVSYIESEKLRSKQLVKERTQQLENTGAIARLGGWEYDVAGQRLSWSKITNEIFGVSGDFSPDLNLMTRFFLDGAGRVKFSAKFRDSLSHGTEWDEELILINATGNEISTRVIGRVEYRNNEINRIIGTIQDITERVLLRNENSFIVETLQLAVWKFFPQTKELRWDKSMYKLYEIDPKQFAGHLKDWIDILTSDSRENAINELQMALDGKKDFNTTFKIKTQSGIPRYIGARGFVKRDEQGNPVSMYGINWDRTKEYKLEEQLMFERAKTLQASKLASLGEMSAAIAHEINNPLAIIQGSVELMTRFVNDPSKLDIKIKTVLKSIDRISKIVNGLRKFSRSSDGYSYQQNSLSEIVREAVSLISVKAQRFNTEIQCDFKVEAAIYCDMVEIEQVVVNLISNGIDAVKANSEKWVRVEVSEEGPFVILKVIDSGGGIAEKNRDKLFEPFFTTKPVGEGTGLGLSITKGILDDHSATIVLDVNGPNTAFVIRFRRVAVDEA